MNQDTENYHGIIVFDGICNFCNSSVNFIIARDEKNLFRFTPMQSSTGQKLLEKHNLSRDNIDTFLLVKNSKALTKSDAALAIAIATELKRPWNYLTILSFIPRPVRDYFYCLVARNRYKWFGKKEQCMIPTPDVRNKFLT